VRYLSVCSGIEAASVAWHRLGWTPVGFSEIEPFPSSVLAHRFPTVPNYGDMTRYEQWPIEPGSVDLLVGGTPCQSFSVAGLRQGLSDPRGGLMLTYLEIARRFRPRWIVWENVPGVLSSGGGRDFGAFLGALGELGYGWAYRVLDAQWVRTHGHPRAVPQRRRRVFVVGRLIERGAGDGAAAASVLFERESVFRNFTAKRKTREEVAADAARCFAGSSESSVAAALETTCHDYSRADGFNAVVQPVANTLGNRGLRSHTELDGHGAYIPAVAFHPTQDPISSIDGSTHCMGTGSGRGDATIAVACYMSGLGIPSPPAVAFKVGNSAKARSNAESTEVTPTLSSASGGNTVPAVAFTIGNLARGAGPSPSEEVFPTLKSGGGRGTDDQWPSVMTTMTVRRLTPRECERLQGFPDDWTLVPHRGKPATDGPRYKALGNSMAVNCMEWIGERIANYD
jgi:DNA (cytosine-5)-methyltransferase 1